MENIIYEVTDRSFNYLPCILPEQTYKNYNAFNVPQHFHEELEILFGISGTSQLVTPENNFLLDKGSFAIFLPGTPHALAAFTPTATIRCLKLPVAPEKNPSDFANLKIHPDFCPLTPENPIYPQIFEIYDELIREDTEKKAAFRFANGYLFKKLLLTIFRNIPFVSSSFSATDFIEHCKFMNTTNQYLEKNYSEDITLDDIANHFKYSKNYFCSYFKKVTGKTFSDYLAYFRLEKAKHLLLFSNLSHLVIAMSCGFSSIRSFNRVFKEYTNLSPSEYKALNKNSSN